MDEVDIIILTKRSVHSIAALISRNFFLNIISTFSFFLIAAVLIPEDIGLYTAVIAIQRIISFFTDFGLGAALIQKKEELEDSDIMTSFTLQASITFFVFIIVFLFHGLISSYLHLNAPAERLLITLAFCIFLSSFKTIPSILLERKIRFEKLVIPQIAEQLTFNILLIIFVLKGFRIDSYTIAFLVSSLIGIPFYYYVSPWKMRLGIDKKSLHHLKFGAQFQAKNVLASLKDDALTIFLAKTLTFTQLGYIGFGQRIAFLSFRYVVDNVTKVTFATYSRMQDNLDLLRKAIEKSLFFVSCAMFPILTGLIVVSPYLLRYFPGFHHKWEPALISLIFFSLNALVSSLSSILVNILDANGRVRVTLFLMIIWTILTWIVTPIFILLYGYNGVAIASFLITLTIVITVYFVRQIVTFRFFGSIYKPLICSAVMVVILLSLSPIVIKDLFTLISMILLGGVVYLVCIYAFAKNEFRTAFQTMKVKI